MSRWLGQIVFSKLSHCSQIVKIKKSSNKPTIFDPIHKEFFAEKIGPPPALPINLQCRIYISSKTIASG